MALIVLSFPSLLCLFVDNSCPGLDLGCSSDWRAGIAMPGGLLIKP